MTIIYLHGFGSKGVSHKSNELRKIFGEQNVYSPDLPIEPNKVIKMINTFVYGITSFPLIFVGTSLGGFWANYFSEIWDSPCIVVNPAVNPSETLKKFSVPPSILEQYKEIEEQVQYQNGSNVNLFLAKNDDVLDYTQTIQKFPHTSFTKLTDNGGHRYEENWPLIIARVKEILQ